MSSDPTGQRLGVARQTSACRDKAAAMGWHVSHVYEDNDVSASTGRRRPAYEQMLADLAAGTINAVVVWDLDRLTRRPIEVEHFIDLADRHGVALASVGGDADLATDNGRLFARIKGAVARAEIERKSARQRAANAQRAEAGRPHAGRRAFGYAADGMTVLEDEAAEVRRAAERLIMGGTVRGIAADLSRRGVTTTAGGPWRPTELRRMLANPRYAGLRTVHGEVVGPGAWQAILDAETHASLRAVLSDPSRHRAGRPRRHLLSGVAVCGVCGGRVFGCMRDQGPTYMCETRSHVVRRSEPIDQLVREVVVARLSQDDAASAFARPSDRDEAQALRKEEALVRARLEGLAEAYAAGEIDRAQMRAGTVRLRDRLEAIAAQLASMARIPALSGLVSAEDVGAAWDGLDVDQQRAIIDMLLAVEVRPAGRGARTFDPATVKLTWKTAQVPEDGTSGRRSHSPRVGATTSSSGQQCDDQADYRRDEGQSN